MARYLRRTTQSLGHSELRPPAVIGAGIVFKPVDTTLFAVRRRVRQPRYEVHSFLRPPVVVTAAATFVAAPIRVTYWAAVKSEQSTSRQRRQPTSLLRPPAVVVNARPILVSLAPPHTPQQSALQRRAPSSKLRPPVVVDTETFEPCGFVTDDFERADEAELGGIWVTAPFVGGLALVSNRATKSTAAQNRSLLRQGVRSNDLWRMSARIAALSGSEIINLQVWAAGLTGAVSVIVEPNRITLGVGDFAVPSNPFAIRTVSPGERVALHRSLLAGGFETYDVWHEPLNGAWQKVLSLTVPELAAWQQGPLRPGVQMTGATGGPAIDDFSFCPYSNDPVATTLQRARPPEVSYRLAPPAVVTAAQVAIAPPIRVTLAPPGHQQSALARRMGFARLRPPTVIGAGNFFRGPGVLLAYSRRGAPKSQLRPPTVVDVVRETFYGPTVTLAPSRRGATHSFLRELPIGADATFAGPRTHLAYSRRGRPSSRLLPPVIPPLARPTRVSLAPQRRGVAKSHLFAPAVVGAGIVYRPLQVELTYSRRGRPLSHLQPPAVINTDRYFGPKVTLARTKPQPTVTLLRPPVIPPLAEPLRVTLAPQRRGAPHSRLAPPAVVGAGIVYRALQVELTYSRRGRPLSHLAPPAVINTDRYFGPATHLARNRPQPTVATLYPPVIPSLAEPPRITLAPQRRGVPKPHLAPPAVVGAGIVYRAVQTHLTYSLRGRPVSALYAPTVVAEPDRYFGPRVTLARNRPQPTTTTLGVFPPQAVVYAPIRTHLTYSLRGVAKSRLGGLPPDSERRFYGPLVHLTYSLRGKPFSQLLPVTPGKEPFRPVQVTLASNAPKPTVALLRAPVVVQAQNVVFYGPAVTLTPSRRGRPLSRLRPPTIVGAGIAFYGPGVRLAESRRGRPKSRLAPPTVVARQELPRGPAVTLAPQRRGQPKSALRPPRVLRLQEPDLAQRRIAVTLAPSSRGAPHSFLRPPQVVRLAVEIYGPEITLAPSRFPRPKSILHEPVVVGKQPFRGLLVHLAYSRRGRPFSTFFPGRIGTPPFRPILVRLAPSTRGAPTSLLRPPAVVDQPPFRGLLVSLTVNTVQPTVVRLAPPQVVNAAEAFYGPLLWLAYSRRGKPIVLLLPPTVTEFFRPHGDVCGFDIAGSFICFTELPGSSTSGGDRAGSTVLGSGVSARRDTISGSDRAGGGATGGDRKST